MTDLATHDLSRPKYIIKTRFGLFFLQWRDFDLSPEMTVTEALARRFSSEEADFVLKKMRERGIKVDKFEVKS
jgi:pentatricopeptide repeat protein